VRVQSSRSSSSVISTRLITRSLRTGERHSRISERQRQCKCAKRRKQEGRRSRQSTQQTQLNHAVRCYSNLIARHLLAPVEGTVLFPKQVGNFDRECGECGGSVPATRRSINLSRSNEACQQYMTTNTPHAESDHARGTCVSGKMREDNCGDLV
jgi:hypothetical protein